MGLLDPEKYNFKGRGVPLGGYYPVWTRDPDGVCRRCVMVVYNPPRPEIIMLRSKIVPDPGATVS